MKKVTIIRMILTLLIGFIDFVIAPGILFKAYTIRVFSPELFIPDLQAVIQFWGVPKMRMIWFYLQPATIVAVAWVWLQGRSNLHQFSGDAPGPAGHGQFGTARWMTEMEADRTFSKHFF